MRVKARTDALPKVAKTLHSTDGSGSIALPPLAELTVAAANCVASADADLPLIEKVTAHARRLARQRGAAEVTIRDIRDAADVIGGSTILPSPADIEPAHIDEVVKQLASLRQATLRLSGGGCRRIRVLVTGERSAVVARMFREAGAEVATCDLQATEDPSIPHFQGDVSLIQDQGWDLVIGHPPCTYLANSGVNWLHRDPQRWLHLLNNASVFRRFMSAKAPFVAVENSKMHKYGKALIGDLSPTQYVHK